VGERGVEAASACPANEVGEPRRHRRRLPDRRASAVTADHVGIEAVEAQEPEVLTEVAGGDLDLSAAPAQDVDERPEDEHVGGRRDIDPDSHPAVSLVAAVYRSATAA
jgi:hypothetical protein